ncbi:MAG: nickel pincer cofactor biosynthesis protein LarB [Puniceicoccaceae bacterium]
MSHLRKILEAVESGQMEVDAAVEKLRSSLYEDIGHSRVDHDRLERNGAAEVIFGEGKSPQQLIDITNSLLQREQDVLITRVSSEKAEFLMRTFPEAEHSETARTLVLKKSPTTGTESFISIVCAGTSDLPVAEEARITAEFYGNTVNTIYDAGVAGLHRLVADLETLRKAKVVIAVAGMEGALPSVVGGLVSVPVIAVPTSVGYGASFGGVAALLGMLTSCASGLSVVNIDNGFGAAYLANMINRI